MIKKIIQFLFSPIQVKTVEDCKKEFNDLYEQSVREAVAFVSRGNVNLSSGSYLTEIDIQRCSQEALSRLKGL